MKIESTVKTSAPSPVQEERNARTAKQREETASKSPVSVQLSPLSAQLSKIEAGLESEKAVDSQKVAEIKRAIDNGTFKVDAEKVADRLIEHNRDFLRAQKQ
jgi:negative regulator of flagellin synthesis FlgM